MDDIQESFNGMTAWLGRHRVWTAVIIIAGSLLLALAVLNALPVTVNNTAVPNPANSHDAAALRVLAIRQAQEQSGVINPVCESILMSHGEMTDNVIVFFHGFTSCPEQYRELGQLFYDMGYNVYIPLLPHHGQADRDRDALLHTSAEELAAFATDAVDIAFGLGDRTVVSGLSGGGTIAAWVAQNRPDVDRAVIVAPFLGIGFIPAALNRPLARILDNIPNVDMWWDPETKENNPNTADYAYPGYPLHALAEYMRLGFATQDQAKQARPAAHSIVVINNENDDSVNNTVTNQLVAIWEGRSGSLLSTIDFAAALGLPHDLITPTREDSDTGLVYPVIVEAIEKLLDGNSEQ